MACKCLTFNFNKITLVKKFYFRYEGDVKIWYDIVLGLSLISLGTCFFGQIARRKEKQYLKQQCFEF